MVSMSQCLICIVLYSLCIVWLCIVIWWYSHTLSRASQTESGSHISFQIREKFSAAGQWFHRGEQTHPSVFRACAAGVGKGKLNHGCSEVPACHEHIHTRSPTLPCQHTLTHQLRQNTNTLLWPHLVYHASSLANTTPQKNTLITHTHTPQTQAITTVALGNFLNTETAVVN